MPAPDKPALRLRVNPIACSGHGVCAELLPELITLDEWGYPLLPDEPVPPGLVKQARRTVTDCPALALLLTRRSSPGADHQVLIRTWAERNNDERA